MEHKFDKPELREFFFETMENLLKDRDINNIERINLVNLTEKIIASAFPVEDKIYLGVKLGTAITRIKQIPPRE